MLGIIYYSVVLCGSVEYGINVFVMVLWFIVVYCVLESVIFYSV